MDHVEAYLEWLEFNKGRADRTVVKYRQLLARLQTFLDEKEAGSLKEMKIPPDGITQLQHVTRTHLNQFTGIYAHQVLKLKPRARRPLVAAVRGFYHWLQREGAIDSNPAADIEYPNAGRRLPRNMSLENAEKLLMQCDMSDFVGVRDAAILGVMIGCGPRVSGVCRLNESDLYWYSHEGKERLAIRFLEKGEKERLVPAPAETALLIHAYLGHQQLEEIDRTLENGDRVLFVSVRNRLVPAHEYHGEHRRIAERSVFDRIRLYGEQAGIPEEQLHPHALRHLFGTEMTEHDTNLFIHQELMGHADPKTTQIYNTLAMRQKMKAIDKASPMRNIRTPVTDLVRHIENSR